MIDRIPRYPGRVKITYPDGRVETATISMDDDPVTNGTALNKANLLSDNAADSVIIDRVSGTVSDAIANGNSIIRFKNYGIAPSNIFNLLSDFGIKLPDVGKTDMISASTKSHIIFINRQPSNGIPNYYAFDESLTRTNVAKPSPKIDYFTSAQSAGGNAVFLAPLYTFVYDDNLTLTDKSSVFDLGIGRYNPVNSKINGNIIISNKEHYGARHIVKAVDSSFTSKFLTEIEGINLSHGTFNSSYAMFVVSEPPGSGNQGYNVIYYDSLLTRGSKVESTTQNYSNPTPGRVGDYAMFLSGELRTGYDSNGYRTFAVNSNLMLNSLYMPIRACSSATFDNYCIMYGIRQNSAPDRKEAAIWTDSLVYCKINSPQSSENYGTGEYSAGIVGDYAVFGAQEVYTKLPTYDIMIPGMSAYKFDNIVDSEVKTQNQVRLSGIGPLNGYIKRGGFSFEGISKEERMY